ncbi:hypothetical protein [Fibrobacter sp.]|uniref:hypothetical protein n=1 Tax=Fibrobacter sp. TaxID=35828 RepID=UPI00386BEFF2
MILAKYIVALGCAALLGACSSTVSSDDDEIISEKNISNKKISSSSTSKKGKSSSSVNESEEECSGESGNPWDGTTAKSFACGSGTKLSPYMILTAEQLAYLSFIVGSNDKDYKGKYFKLGADILLNKGKIIDDKGGFVADSAKLHKWTPIGNSSVAFDGTFDGDNHSISGMFINTTSSNNGLFGNSRGIIQNLTLSNAWVYGGKYTGGIIGYNVGTVENLTNLASVSGKEDCIGGVMGSSNQKDYKSNSVVKKAVNEGIIIGNKNVGGVAGCATYVTVDGAENSASIEGNDHVGGIFGGIGSTSKNDVKNLRNTGNINGTHFVGGISGHCGGNALLYSNGSSSYSCSKNSFNCGSFTNSHNQGRVTGKDYVGGISGMACSGTISSLSNIADIEGVYGTAGIIGSVAYITSANIYNTGNIYGGNYVGGIFSYNKEGVTSAAYSTGKVDGDSLVGLMIGYNYNTTMADYYYLEQGEQEPFGLNNGGGVATPKSSKEMKSEKFTELLGDEFIYDADVNDGYPILKSETEGD